MSNLVVFYAFATPAVSGTTIIGAVAGSRIIVSQACVITTLANNVKFQSNNSTDISATFPLAPNGGFVLPYSELGWMQTNIGEALTFSMTTGTSTAVQVVYCLSTN